MYKVLVVDDERMIRMGIKKVIPWEALEVGEVYTAASGMEALEILRDKKPEIMLTDIQMTEMTGLELIEEARKIVTDLRIIVLTGYDNFEYARQSLRLKVQDFFLKPIDEEDLTEAVAKQVEELDSLMDEEKNKKSLWRIQGTVQQTRLEKCIRDMIHNREDKAYLLEILQKEFMFEENQKMQVALIAPQLYGSKWGAEEQFRTLSVKNICMSMVDARGMGITFLDDDGTIYIVFFEKEGGEDVLEELGDLSDILADEFDSKPKMVVGSSVHGFENLHISYNDANYLMENEKENIRDIVQTLGAQNKVKLFKDVYAELKNVMCTNVGNTAYVLKAFDTFAKAVKSYNVSSAAVRGNCFEMGSALYFVYKEEGGEADSGKLDALSQSLLSADRDEACEVTRMFIMQLLEKDEENVHYIVSTAKRYIDDHISEELSVSSIAMSLYVTPNYFSRLFKRITKEGCNEYIVRKRIEKAKSLLETTSLKTGKIALMVGYRDTNYFSLAFKKHTGKSPTKYREELQNQ